MPLDSLAGNEIQLRFRYRTDGGLALNGFFADNITITAYDQYMKTGPYNFGFPDKPDWVEHFPYQTGLGVWYWDTSQPDNNTSEHNGQGLIQPIDAHPAPIYNLQGQPWRERIAGYDAPFSLSKADSFALHIGGKPSYIRGEQPNAGVKLPAIGTTIRVLSQNGTSMKIRVGKK